VALSRPKSGFESRYRYQAFVSLYSSGASGQSSCRWTTFGLFLSESTDSLWSAVFSSMANKRVKIYESVKANGKWTSVPVEIPKLKPDNTLYLKDGREGKFRISWYEGTKKQWHPATCHTLGEALKVKAEKEWFLRNQNRPGVQDPTAPDTRHPIAACVAPLESSKP
jgi:hypothetical protein